MRIVIVSLANKQVSSNKISMSTAYMNISQTESRGASPALPPVDELNPVFTPAEIMTATNRILPEKVHLADGSAAAAPRGRTSFAEAIPIPPPILPADPTAYQAAELAPGHKVIRVGHNPHVFFDMSVPAPIMTQWEVSNTDKMAPILPAPKDTMVDAGEEYKIRDAETGKILASAGPATTSDDPVPPALQPRI